MELSEQFLEAYRSNERERERQKREIKERFDTAEGLILQVEKERLLNLLMEKGSVPSTGASDGDLHDYEPGPDFRVGDRVWCSRFKCMGTITEFEVFIDCWDDDYYTRWRVHTPQIGLVAHVQPDPTPRGKVREMIQTAALQLAKGGTSWALSRSEYGWDDDWDDDDMQTDD